MDRWGDNDRLALHNRAHRLGQRGTMNTIETAMVIYFVCLLPAAILVGKYLKHWSRG